MYILKIDGFCNRTPWSKDTRQHLFVEEKRVDLRQCAGSGGNSWPRGGTRHPDYQKREVGNRGRCDPKRALSVKVPHTLKKRGKLLWGRGKRGVSFGTKKAPCLNEKGERQSRKRSISTGSGRRGGKGIESNRARGDYRLQPRKKPISEIFAENRRTRRGEKLSVKKDVARGPKGEIKAVGAKGDGARNL